MLVSDGIYDPAFVKGLFNRMSRSYERMNYVASFGFLNSFLYGLARARLLPPRF